MSLRIFTGVCESVEREFSQSLSAKWQDFCASADGFYDPYKEVLCQGSTDFCEAYKSVRWEFTATEKVLLYCKLGYFNMHYNSSCAVFSKIKSVLEDPILFVDIGCGPGTGGIALCDVCSPRLQGRSGFHYIGIDRSPDMLSRAKQYIAYCEPKSSKFKREFSALSRLVKPFTRLNTVIINLCFVLAPETYKTNGGVMALGGFVNRIMEGHRKQNMYVVYQNPAPEGRGESSYFHDYWHEFKGRMTNMESLEGYPREISYNANNREYRVYCDILRRVQR